MFLLLKNCNQTKEKFVDSNKITNINAILSS